jgi:hypothetical protein
MQTGPPDSAIRLKVGASYSFRLRGRGSAAYLWKSLVEGDPGIVAISLTRDQRPPAPPPGSAPPSNFSLDETVCITGLAPGAAEILLTLERPGDPNSPPLEQFRVQVWVI